MAISNNIGLGRHGYPDPFLDFASTQLPKSYSKMLELCRVFGHTHPQIAPVIKKLAQYPITSVKVETHDSTPANEERWKNILENNIDIYGFCEKMGLDYHGYGVAYAIFHSPFYRVYTCTKEGCKHSHPASEKKLKYELVGKSFVGRCDKCKTKVKLKAEDIHFDGAEHCSLVRLYPGDVTVAENELTGHKTYYYSPPASLKKALRGNKINRDVIDSTPIQYIEAVLSKVKIQFKPGRVLEISEATMSGSTDMARLPRTLPALKSAYLDQLYRKADESGALERTLPARFVYPQPTSHSPIAMANLGRFTSFLNTSMKKWRYDKNAIIAVPFPIGVSELGNDAHQYNTTPMRNLVRQEIIGSMGAPEGFLSDGMTWSGGSVQLRMLENSMKPYCRGLDRLLVFAASNIAKVLQISECKVKMLPFKMADDMQMLQIKTSLAQQGIIDWQSVLSDLDIVFEEAQQRRKEEEKILGSVKLQQTLSELSIALQQGVTSGSQAAAQESGTQIEGDMTTRRMALSQSLVGLGNANELTEQMSSQSQQEQQQEQEQQQRQQELMIAKEEASIGKLQAETRRSLSDAGKLDEHADYYEAEKQERGKLRAGDDIMEEATRILRSPAARRRELIGALYEASDPQFARAVEQQMIDMQLGVPMEATEAGRGGTSPMVQLSELRQKSSSPQALAESIMMQRPNERMTLLNELMQEDQRLGIMVSKILHEKMGLGSPQAPQAPKANQDNPVRPPAG